MRTSSREKLLGAATTLIRERGYTATSIDELCRAAGVTKGAFFHHFKSKDDLAVAAAEYWSLMTGAFFEEAPYHTLEDPLDRVLGYIRFRQEIIHGDLPEFTCLVGTMVQEVYETQPKIRDACCDSIFEHAQSLVADIWEAKQLYAPQANWIPESLALHTQAVIQGAFILAKAGNDPKLAEESIEHLLNYIQLLFKEESSNDP